MTESAFAHWRTLSRMTRMQDLVTLQHTAIAFIAMLLVVGFLARKALPARTVVRHLEVCSMLMHFAPANRLGIG